MGRTLRRWFAASSFRNRSVLKSKVSLRFSRIEMSAMWQRASSVTAVPMGLMASDLLFTQSRKLRAWPEERTSFSLKLSGSA